MQAKHAWDYLCVMLSIEEIGLDNAFQVDMYFFSVLDHFSLNQFTSPV